MTTRVRVSSWGVTRTGIKPTRAGSGPIMTIMHALRGYVKLTGPTRFILPNCPLVSTGLSWHREAVSSPVDPA